MPTFTKQLKKYKNNKIKLSLLSRKIYVDILSHREIPKVLFLEICRNMNTLFPVSALMRFFP